MLGGIELWRERRRDEYLALLADDEFAGVGRPARLFCGLFADPGARRHVLIRPDMDDLVQRPDFGVPEGGERRQFRAVRQCLGKALLEFRRGAGVQRIGADLDDHSGVLPGVRDPDASPPRRLRQGQLATSTTARAIRSGGWSISLLQGLPGGIAVSGTSRRDIVAELCSFA